MARRTFPGGFRSIDYPGEPVDILLPTEGPFYVLFKNARDPRTGQVLSTPTTVGWALAVRKTFPDGDPVFGIAQISPVGVGNDPVNGTVAFTQVNPTWRDNFTFSQRVFGEAYAYYSLLYGFIGSGTGVVIQHGRFIVKPQVGDFTNSGA